MTDKRYWTIKQFCAYFPWPPEGGLRYLIFHKEQNGFAPAILKVGKRVLIDVDKFWEILKDKQVKKEE